MNEQTQYLKNTPLHIAAKFGHYLIVKYLVEAGANFLITNKDGLSPFDLADQSKQEIDRMRSNSKGKIGGPGYDVHKTQALYENLDAILRMLTRSTENMWGYTHNAMIGFF